MAKSKIEQYNQSFKKAIGTIILKLIPNIPQFSITDVLIDPSLQNGRVWVSGTTDCIELIKEKRPEIQAHLKDYVKTRYTPKLTFIADDRYLEHLDNLFSELDKQEGYNKN